MAFLSARPAAGDADAGTIGAARNQVWLLPMSGGEPRRVTTLVNGVQSFSWSPDGTRLVCVSRTGPSDTVKSPSDVRHYKHANINSTTRDGSTTSARICSSSMFDPGAPTRSRAARTGTTRDPQWSPDGAKIAFVSDRTGKEFDEGRNRDIWVIDAAGGSPVKVVERPEPDNSPRWSPDGATIAFVSANEERAHPKIWLVAASGGTPQAGRRWPRSDPDRPPLGGPMAKRSISKRHQRRVAPVSRGPCRAGARRRSRPAIARFISST